MTSSLVAVERGQMSRHEALERTLTTLRFFRDSPQGTEPDATGYKGFYYHFLDMETGRRAGNCELSSIDTALLLAGFLSAAQYFDRANAAESELRSLVDELYGRVEWDWMLNDGAVLSNGWKPKSGFLPYSWKGYSEGSLLYLLALGSPDASDFARLLAGLEFDLRLAAGIRLGIPVCGAVVHSSTAALLDRLSVYSGRLYAGESDGLLREQPQRYVCAAAVRDGESASVRRVWRTLLGADGFGWAGTGPSHKE